MTPNWMNFYTYLSFGKSSEVYNISMIFLIYSLYCCYFLYIFFFTTHSFRIFLFPLRLNIFFPSLYVHIEMKYLQSFIRAVSSSLSHFIFEQVFAFFYTISSSGWEKLYDLWCDRGRAFLIFILFLLFSVRKWGTSKKISTSTFSHSKNKKNALHSTRLWI